MLSVPRTRALAAVLVAAAATITTADPPTVVGRFAGYTRALPNDKLPSVPILGNGALGVLLDAHDDKHAAAGPGRDNTIDIWLSSGGMWSCGACTTLAKGCCRLVSLGGLSLSFLSTFPRPIVLAYAAEQRIGAAQLAASFATPGGGTVGVLAFMHPTEHVVIVNVTYSAAGSDPPALALNASLWVSAASANGAGPAPQSVGCLDASSLQPAACAASVPAASQQLVYASRAAATAANSPAVITAGLAARVVGAGTASFAVTASAPGGAWEATISTSLASGGGPLTLVVGEAEVARGAGGRDSVAAAASLAAAATPAGVAAAAATWWSAFWARSSVSLPGDPQLAALWAGAQYALGATASTDAAVAAPALYGVWATSDACAWQGDFTLDYNAEATFFGAFSSNHAAQAESYWQFLLDWQVPGRAMAAQQAAGYGISCNPAALHYACHLAPWGFQSFDTTYYMHWNGHYSTLLFINHFEYTLNATYARAVAYPYLAGHNAWWACALNKTRTGAAPGDYVYRDTLHDAEHEGHVVADPQIGIALAARTVRAQLDMARLLGLPPPSELVDIDAHLVPFNTAAWNYTAPPLAGNVSYTLFPDARLSGDDGMTTGVPTLAACEALCTAQGAGCALFTFCPNTSVPGCDVGASCWRYAADKLPTLHAGPGFVSGRKDGPPPPPPQELRVWAAFAGATAAQSDSFALYPLWPTEFVGSTGMPLDAATAAVAQASTRAYIQWAGGRSVDVFASAVAAGAGFGFPPERGGSVVRGGPPAPPYAIAPAEVLAGFKTQADALLGGNLLLYAPGGGVENVGVSRAVNDMLATSIGGLGGVVTLFPFWPATQPAAFTSLLVKGGIAVSARYDNVTAAVASPVVVVAAYTLDGAATAAVRLADPWGVGAGGGVTVTCGGAAPPVAWTGAVMSFDAPAGVDCAVALPPAPDGASTAA